MKKEKNNQKFVLQKDTKLWFLSFFLNGESFFGCAFI